MTDSFRRKVVDSGWESEALTLHFVSRIDI